MPLALIGIDPETDQDHCPAVFLDAATGDLVFQGWTITDPATLGEIHSRSPISPAESAVRLPARMAPIVRDALAALEAADGTSAPLRGAAGRM